MPARAAAASVARAVYVQGSAVARAGMPGLRPRMRPSPVRSPTTTASLALLLAFAAGALGAASYRVELMDRSLVSLTPFDSLTLWLSLRDFLTLCVSGPRRW